MKVEEALFKCKYEVDFGCGTDDEAALENIVINALEKQIPKKLVARDLFEMSTATGHSCPSCGYDFPIGIYRLYKYCPECGQAIERATE